MPRGTLSDTDFRLLMMLPERHLPHPPAAARIDNLTIFAAATPCHILHLMRLLPNCRRHLTLLLLLLLQHFLPHWQSIISSEPCRNYVASLLSSHPMQVRMLLNDAENAALCHKAARGVVGGGGVALTYALTASQVQHVA